MTLNLTFTPQLHTDFSPRITVIGVGGGGTNAVNTMISLDLKGVEFVVANTDAQSLQNSRADRRIQLGPHLTQGLGAGAKPEIGRAAAEEAVDEIYRHLDGVHMVFITAGMGGGTGTGAAPVIARMARERGILTVGVVTKPFTFEGVRRMRSAEQGIDELQQWVDTLIVIPNQNLFRLSNERTGFKEAFNLADNVLYMGVRGVTDLMVAPGLINLDFADIRTVMAEMGKAMMGTGEADGENRALRAAELAISNPLLEDTSMSGAQGLLINITGGDDMTLFEVDQAANRIREEVDENANIIFGSSTDEQLNGRIRVSVVATGIENQPHAAERPHLMAVGGIGSGSVSAPPMSVPPQGPMSSASFGATPAAPVSAPSFGAAPMPRNLGSALAREPVARMAPTERPMPPIAAPMTAPMASPGAAPHAETSAPRSRFAEVRLPENRGPEARAPEARAAEQRPVEIEAIIQSEVDLDEPPLPPRQIPAHLQQPLRPAPLTRPLARPSEARTPETRAPEPRMSDPRLAQRQAPGSEAPPPGSSARKSLFSIVTGAIRGQAAGEMQAAPAGRMEPIASDYTSEPPRAQVRQAGPDDIGIEIPAFLRRQN
jgi:cell division protein FtsZ